MKRNKDYWNWILVAVAVIIIIALFAYNPKLPAKETELKKFNSLEQLKEFLKSNMEIAPYFEGFTRAGINDLQATAAPTGAEAAKSSTGAEDYSTTNIQVAGVDEPDFVKNDGEYIYVVSGQKVLIVDSYPAENANIVSQINFSGNINEIFVNGDDLVVFGTETGYYPLYDIEKAMIMPPIYSSQKTSIKIYNISDKENPVLKKNISADGYYYDARMIGDYVYVVTNQQIYSDNIIMPRISVDGSVQEIKASEIYYFDYPDYSYTFTDIVSFNVNGGEVSTEVFLTSYTQNMFVSQDNIYLTYSKRFKRDYFFNKLVDEVYIPVFPNNIANKIKEIKNSDDSIYDKHRKILDLFDTYVESLDAEQQSGFFKEVQDRMNNLQEEIWKEEQKTVVHRIEIKNGKAEYKAEGEVVGMPLNQFSMDEYNGHFRIATTTMRRWWVNEQEQQVNSLYVLNMDMKTVGKLEGLAPGERIYSARFIEDRVYLVTFKQVDPLFVIDLSNPAKPEVLGQLKITGFSSYLHPYDETHLIGIGQEANETTGRTEGLKIALFDVSDVSQPREISKYVFPQGSYSEALYDHKAFLFDKKKNLLVIPVNIYNWIYEEGKDNSFYGAYVFDISLQGIKEKGRIVHDVNETYKKWQSNIRRALYMDNVLYTVSNVMIKMNSLDDMSEINKVDLPYEQFYGIARGWTAVE